MNLDLTEMTLDQLAAPELGRVLVLTVNNRHARRLVTQLSAQLGEDRPVMALPDIMPFQAWVRQITEQLAFADESRLAAYRVDGFGSQLLWQQVIREAEAAHYLLDIPQAARLARDADQLMSNWMLSVPASAQTPDYQRFAVWREAYRERLAQADAEDDTLGFEQVCLAMQAGQLHLDVDWVVLAGFHELSPRLTHMLTVWAEAGSRLARLQETVPMATSMSRVCAPSPEQEWQWAVDWACDQLHRHPQGRYAILAPQLESQVPLAHRLLNARLSVADESPALAFNIAVARPLGEWPLAWAALSWLELMAACLDEDIPPGVAGQALLAGHCTAHDAESGARAGLDAQWRHKAVMQLSQASLLLALQTSAPRLAQAWEAVTQQLPAADDRADILAWVPCFKRLLSALGFPGVATLDSVAHQVLEAFEKMLDDLARQRVVLQHIRFDQAVLALRTLLSQTPFQPQRDLSARLDVLGFLEAEGGRWDGVWVLGLTDEVLPAAPSPNPFVPLMVQRHAGTPRATPERELEWAQASFAMIQRCAPQLIVSSAAFEGERELRPSPFIADWPQSDKCWPEPVRAAAATLERLDDNQGPPLTAGQASSGGVAVLETQARNPLWAFVKYRLRARQLPAYADPAQQAVRGMFLHACAELFCASVRSQHHLQQLLSDDDALAQTLMQQIQQAARQHLQAYTPVVRELECERALVVLLAWVQQEQRRVPYEIVALEEDNVWTHGALQLKLRLDRVDRLASGERVIIDYKTGAGRLDPRADWVRQPPLNLQLPFYAAVLGGADHDVAALALVRLHAREVAVSGLADIDTGLEGLAGMADWKEMEGMTWVDLMARWRQDIESLAVAYADGWAANQTRHPADLEYCDVLPFLRLHEEDGHEL